MVFAVPIDHPVLSISADFQFEGGDVVGLMGLLGNSSLGSDPGQYLEEVKIHLKGEWLMNAGNRERTKLSFFWQPINEDLWYE